MGKKSGQKGGSTLASTVKNGNQSLGKQLMK